MKTKIARASILLILLATLVLPVIPVSADGSSSLVDEFIGVNVPVYAPLQNQTFYAAGRHWAFFPDGTGALGEMYYTSSADGSSWEAKSALDSGLGAPYSHMMDVVYDGVYLHYAIWRQTATYEQEIYYRRGLPLSNGTITWSAARQTVMQVDDDPNPMEAGGLAVDSDGYPYIVWGEETGDYTKIIRSSTNNGTWTTDAGFSTTLSETGRWGTVAALTGGKMYAIYSDIDQTPNYLRGRLWTGSEWGDEEIISSDRPGTYPASQDTYFDFTTIGDTVHVVYSEAVDFDAYYRNRSVAGVWSDPVLIHNEDTWYPHIVGLLDGDISIIYTYDDAAYYERRYIDGAWQADVNILNLVASYGNYMVTSRYADEDTGIYSILYAVNETPQFELYYYWDTAPLPEAPAEEPDVADDLMQNVLTTAIAVAVILTVIMLGGTSPVAMMLGAIVGIIAIAFINGAL